MQRYLKWLFAIALAITTPEFAFAEHATPQAWPTFSTLDTGNCGCCGSPCLITPGGCLACPALPSASTPFLTARPALAARYVQPDPAQLQSFGEPPEPPPPRDGGPKSHHFNFGELS